MKTYTNSKGESLPKVICAVVEFENKRLGPASGSNKDSKQLWSAFSFGDSNIFSDSNFEKWETIWRCNYDHFYSIFPTCKNSRGQELPEEIQVEIVEERLRQGLDKPHLFLGFIFRDALKGSDYWLNIWESDYTPTELPTKSDDTFTQGEIVEVSNNENSGFIDSFEYAGFYKGNHIVFNPNSEKFSGWKFCRKVQPLELTLPELLTIAEEVKGTKVILKS